jgi:hypothetical protein
LPSCSKRGAKARSSAGCPPGTSWAKKPANAQPALCCTHPPCESLIAQLQDKVLEPASRAPSEASRESARANGSSPRPPMRLTCPRDRRCMGSGYHTFPSQPAG